MGWESKFSIRTYPVSEKGNTRTNTGLEDVCSYNAERNDTRLVSEDVI
jgi:hypothetical protein